MRPLNRIKPRMAPQAFKTYGISAPKDTHFREGTCEEAECQVQAKGWITAVDESTDLGQRQAHYIRKLSGRPYTESRDPGKTIFTFPPGAECFQQHLVRVDRPELYLVRGGDWRQDTGLIRKHDNPEGWVEDFSENLDGIRTRVERG